MFHSYRSGKYPISDKAWRKLEAAEQRAGIEFAEPKNAESSTKPKETMGSNVPTQGETAAEKEAGEAFYIQLLIKLLPSLDLASLVTLGEDMQSRKPPGYEAVMDALMPIIRSRHKPDQSPPEES